MARLFDGFQRALDANGDPVAGAKLTLFRAGTSDAVTTYSDEALSVANASPVVADAEGAFGPIYVGAGAYKVQTTDASDVQLPGSPADNVVLLEGSSAIIYATKAAVEAAEINADIDVIMVQERTSGAGAQSGGRYERAASEPSHAGKIQSADGAWWALAENPATPEMFGAVGDGTTNDATAVQNCVNFCIATGAEMRLVSLYGIGSPITIKPVTDTSTLSTEADNFRMIGGLGFSETVTTSKMIGFKKLAGWTGAGAAGAAIKIGDVDASDAKVAVWSQGCLLDGFIVDCDERVGDGIAAVKTTNLTARGVCVFDAPAAGFRIDGVFFAYLETCGALGCGSNSAGGSGGFVWGTTISNSGTGRRRNNADGMMIRCYTNAVDTDSPRGGNAGLYMEPRVYEATDPDIEAGPGGDEGAGTYQTGTLHVIGGEFGSVAGGKGCVVVDGVSINFTGVTFGCDKNFATDGGVKIGNTSATANSKTAFVTFQACYFLTDAEPIKHAIKLFGHVEGIHVTACRRDGLRKLIDLNTASATLTGAIHVDQTLEANGVQNIAVSADQEFTNVPFAWVGRGPTATSGVILRASEDEDPVSISTRASGGTAIASTFSEFRFSLGDRVAIDIPPKGAAALEAATLVAGSLVNWDGTGSFSTYTGFSSGAGVYRMGSATAAGAHLG